MAAIESGESYRGGFPAKVEVIKAVLRNGLFLPEVPMKQNRLSLYYVDLKYIRALAGKDHNVRSISPQIGKSFRPFIGIIVICDEKQYCIPLSSPKEKHQYMNNDVDFSKIYDGKGKLIGVLNFNNMIPICPDVIKKIDLKIHPSDNFEMKARKNLMINQLTVCRQNQDAIVRKANKLYRIVTSEKANFSLKKRCCNFQKLEEVLAKY